MAEGVGFEPTVGCPTAVFKTAAFVRSATPPARHSTHELALIAASVAVRSAADFPGLPQLRENAGVPHDTEDRQDQTTGRTTPLPKAKP